MRGICALVSAVALVWVAATPAAVSKTLVIRLKSIAIASTVHDVPPKGISKGDAYVGRFRLLNVVPQFGRPAGAAVGKERSTLTLTTRTNGVVTGAVVLPGGTIRYRGAGRLGSDAPIPVVGGTGRFAGARGTLIIGKGNSPLNTYRLTLP